MPLTIFHNLTEKDKSIAIQNLIASSSPRQEFFLMTVLSILMASLGILIDNIIVVIGSMLIAPMLYPIMSLSLGIVIADSKLITRSAVTIIKSIIISLIAAAFIALFADPLTDFNSQNIISSIKPSLAYATIAIISGLAASFALIKPQMNATLPGVAISVALIPPLATIRIGIARLQWSTIANASTLLLINIVGIVFAAVIIFSLINLYVKRKIAEKAIKEDEKEIKNEIKKATKDS